MLSTAAQLGFTKKISTVLGLPKGVIANAKAVLARSLITQVSNVLESAVLSLL